MFLKKNCYKIGTLLEFARNSEMKDLVHDFKELIV